MKFVRGPVAGQGRRCGHALPTPMHHLQPTSVKGRIWVLTMVTKAFSSQARRAVFRSLFVHLLGGSFDQTTLNLMFPSVR